MTALSTRQHRELEWASHRRAFYFTGLLVPLFSVADAVVVGGFSLPAFLLRLGWAGSLVALGWVLPRISEPMRRIAIAAAGALSAMFYLAICAVTGGFGSPLFAWNLALPLAVAVIAQQYVSAVVAGSVASLLGELLLMSLWRVPAQDMLVQLLMLLASISVAIYASAAWAQLHATERRVEEQRIAALEQLAESERRRARSERLAVLGQLSAGIAHEINNPLHTLLLTLDVVEKNPALLDAPEKRVARLAALRSAADRISQIVLDLRGYAKEPQREEQQASIPEAVEAAIRLATLRLKRVTRVERALPPELPPARIGPRQLSQVLVNLLINAGDALEEAGRDDSWVRVRAERTDGTIELSIEDNGPGLTPELLGKVFKEPITTKPGEQGTGLGLTLTREFVERAGGTVRAENRPEGGCRIVIRLQPVG